MRVHEPARIAAALAGRRRRAALTRDGMLFIVAADHTARAMVGLGDDPLAMADRRSMLDRLLTALAHPRVDGVLASADILEDLVLLGALEDRVAVGTMNRGGLAGATWELDDRFTAYDPEHIVTANLDAGKMLLRIDGRDPGTVPTLAACARAVGELNDRRIMAMVEPIPYTKDATGKAVWDDDPLQLVKAVGVCAALGGSSAYTWLKIQATADIATVAAMTTQPLLLLGGAPGRTPRRRSRHGRPPSPNRPSAGSSSAGRCCIPRTVTSPAPSPPRRRSSSTLPRSACESARRRWPSLNWARIVIWARPVPDSRLSAPRRPNGTMRTQISGRDGGREQVAR